MIVMELSFDPAAEPITGRLATVSGPDQSFVGYVELISTLEQARAAAREAAGADTSGRKVSG
jgi:hypothetical protein